MQKKWHGKQVVIREGGADGGKTGIVRYIGVKSLGEMAFISEEAGIEPSVFNVTLDTEDGKKLGIKSLSAVMLLE